MLGLTAFLGVPFLKLFLVCAELVDTLLPTLFYLPIALFGLSWLWPEQGSWTWYQDVLLAGVPPLYTDT